MPLLCPHCFDNKGLQNRLIAIRPDFPDDARCDFHPSRKGIPLKTVAAIVDVVFRQNITFGEMEPDFVGDSLIYRQRGDTLWDTVSFLTEAVNEQIAAALVAQLIADDSYWPGDGEAAFYDEETQYERITHGEAGHGHLWESFCQTIMHEQRFFNRDADGLLADIFRNIHLQSSTSRDYPIHVLEAGGALEVYRARIVDDEELNAVHQDPCLQLGAPPLRRGRPNRMNPSGVLAFYGSLDLQTCISELRPVVGTRVVSGQFRIRRPIVVLDTTRFEAPPRELNLFARDHVRRLSQWRFMQRFMMEIAKPISPSDEHLDYVPTQAVAEYLNKVHTVPIRKEERQVEAILYRSAQRPTGTNIVFFGDAAHVEKPQKSGEGRPSRSMPSFDISAVTAQPPVNPGLALVSQSLRVDEITEAVFQTGFGYHLGEPGYPEF